MCPMLIAVDVDGTLEVGDPPGPVKIQTLANICRSSPPGVVIVSDSYLKVWRRTDLTGHLIPACAVPSGKIARLKALRSEYPAEGRYVMVGDSDEDAEAAREAGYEYMTPQQFAEALERGLV